MCVHIAKLWNAILVQIQITSRLHSHVQIQPFNRHLKIHLFAFDNNSKNSN